MNEMKPMERIDAVCKHEIPDRVPFFLASREFGMKQAGIPFSKAFTDPECYIESQLAIQKKYQLDTVMDIWATPVVDEALGANLIFPEDDAPVIDYHPYLQNITEWSKLKTVNPLKDGRMPYMVHLVSQLKKRVGKDIPVVAWISQPFRTACMLRGEANLYKDMIRKPKEVIHLIETVYDSLLFYGKALIDAGADMITTSNPVANMECISKKMYLKFSHPYTQKIFRELKDYGAKYTMFHTCGKWDDRFDLICEENVDILHLDKVELSGFKEKYGDRVVACGNIRTSETLLHGTNEQVYEETKECIASAKEGGRFILSANCAVPRDTSSEHIQIVKNVLNQYGYYSA